MAHTKRWSVHTVCVAIYCILTRKTNLGLIAKVFNETVRVVVLGLVEWVERREIIQILVVLIPHVVSYTVRKRAREYHYYYDKNI